MSPRLPVTLALLLIGGAGARAQTGAARWKVHDLKRPVPPVVTPANRPLPVPAPSDALMLFDGRTLDHWQAQDGGLPRWKVENQAMVAAPGSGSLVTKESFGDMQLHIEWSTPSPTHGQGQDRGNSGVYIMGRYEVQVLDSFESSTYPDGQAASIYGQYPPLSNASLPPGEWQSFDIAFRRPRFTEAGALEQPARLTVFHNGVLVQNNEELWGGTSWLGYHPYEPHADQLPLSLQDHGHPVRFRNIWVRQWKPRAPAPLVRQVVLELTDEELDRYVGDYTLEGGKQIYSIRRNGRQVSLHLDWKPVDLVLLPRTRQEFLLRDAAASVLFEFTSDGRASALTFRLGSTERRASR